MIPKIPRVFIPLNTSAYEWFDSGKKKWELRKYGRQYTEKNIYKGRIVELRKGYSNPSTAIWGVVNKVIVFNSIVDIFDNVEFEEIIPVAKNKKEAIEISEKFFKNENGKYILIQIETIKSPTIIEIDDDYIDLIRTGEKSTTIRMGKRDYKTGLSIFFSEKRSIILEITAIEYQMFSEINESDAIKDGFNSLNELVDNLHVYYPALNKTDIVTIVSFKLYGGEK